MLKRIIFAPEEKELRAESYTRCSVETNGLRGRQHESSKFAGTGHGLGNEYMLINAVAVAHVWSWTVSVQPPPSEMCLMLNAQRPMLNAQRSLSVGR